VGEREDDPVIVRAILISRVLDGVELIETSVPVGKRYLVDLDRRLPLHWINEERGAMRDLDCVPDVVNGGWLPVELLSFTTLHEVRPPGKSRPARRQKRRAAKLAKATK
jgi:hypothetical protein